MNEELAKGLYDAIVVDGTNTYRDLFETTKISSKTTEYWKNALSLYHSLNSAEKEVLFSIINQVIVDSVSSVLGIFDGTSNLNGANFDFSIMINGKNSNDELQDCFLQYIEEKL